MRPESAGAAIRNEPYIEVVSPIVVCIIGASGIFRAGLQLLLENAGMVVIAESPSLSDHMEALSTTLPDIFIVDLEGTTENGVEILAELVLLFGSPRILALTNSRSPEYHQLAVESGARGIVLKDESADILIKAIKRVDSGDLWLRRSLFTDFINQRPHRVAEQKRKDQEAEKIATLTPREREIIQLVAEGLNGSRIAKRLHVSECTVRNHLTSILDKLGVASKLELAVYAYRNSLAVPPSNVATPPRP